MYSFEDIFLHFLFFEAIYFQSKFCYNLQYPLLRTSWLMRQTIIFLSHFFLLFPIIDSLTFHYSSLNCRSLSCSFLWCEIKAFFFPLLLVLFHFILLLFVADFRVVPSYDVGLWDLRQSQEFESFDLWFMIFFFKFIFLIKIIIIIYFRALLFFFLDISLLWSSFF